MDSRNEEGESFSVQFHTRDIDSLNEWVRKEGGALQQDLIGRYKEKQGRESCEDVYKRQAYKSARKRALLNWMRNILSLF